jgi:hypothetical protein
MKQFEWNIDTLKYFRELKEQGTLTELKREVWYFVSHNCEIEEEETYNDLAKDLFKQILNYEANYGI